MISGKHFLNANIITAGLTARLLAQPDHVLEVTSANARNDDGSVSSERVLIFPSSAGEKVAHALGVVVRFMTLLHDITAAAAALGDVKSTLLIRSYKHVCAECTRATSLQTGMSEGEKKPSKLKKDRNFTSLISPYRNVLNVQELA